LFTPLRWTREQILAAYDLLIVGGGVQGLWIARSAIQAGMSVALVEANACGTGASGGLLGALMPHVPTGWSEKKQFQFEALVRLETETRKLTEETGIDTGYSRCGRAMPIRAKGFLDQFPSRRAASWLHWQTVRERFELATLTADALDGWLDPERASLGIFWDPLAARINPPQYIAALKSSIADRCVIHENWRFVSYNNARGQALNDNGDVLIAAHIVLAAGYETFSLTRPMTGLELGGGVKGQAALLAASMPEQRPIIFDDGMYIVAHSTDLCAVGSTTEPDWDDPASTSDLIDARVDQARRLCPPLRDAPIVATWAGVRPQSAARDPIIGRLHPEHPVYIASGGFKITLGIAHLAAERLVDGIVTDRTPTGLPASFSPQLHVTTAQSKIHP
jgi:glycine oxidase